MTTYEYACACRCGCGNDSQNPVDDAGICTACVAGDHLECDPDCDGPEPHFFAARENAVTEDTPIYEPTVQSWKPEVFVDGKWASNGLRFRTRDEAERSGRELLTRWFVPTDSRATPSDDRPNYRLDLDDRPVGLCTAKSGCELDAVPGTGWCPQHTGV